MESKTNSARKIGRNFQLNELVTIADLEQFKIDMLQSIKSMVTSYSAPSEKKWLKSHEVKTLLGIGDTTLYTIRIENLIPFKKLRGTYYYDMDKIEAALKSVSKTSVPVATTKNPLLTKLRKLTATIHQ